MRTKSFSNANIFMARREGKFYLHDKDWDVFGSGKTYPEALKSLAENYPDNCYSDNQNDNEVRECGCPTYD